MGRTMKISTLKADRIPLKPLFQHSIIPIGAKPLSSKPEQLNEMLEIN